MTSKKKLYLVDGANYMFRAYYALPSLTNSKGFPTNALLGFAQMLMKLVRDEKPDYIALCLDRPEPNFRDEMYADYKANRKTPPDDLKEQFPLMRPLAEAIGLKVVDMAGFEADDVIGTLAKKFASSDVEVVIVSGDKDLMQLVGDGVVMLDEMKKKIVGPAEVVEKFGVGPEGVTEILGLAGDSSDNVPGIAGVGPKTATKLIQEYGSIEEVLVHAGKIKGAIGKKIADGADMARLSKKLVTIDCSVPLNIGLEELKSAGNDAAKLTELFKELEFTRLLALIEGPKAGSHLSFENYKLMTREKTLRDFCKLLKDKDVLCLDLETDSLNVMQANIVGISICAVAGESAYIPVAHKNADGQISLDVALDALKPLFSDPKIKKIGQNLNFDLTILRRLGVEVNGVFFDTLLASYVLNPSSEHGMDALSERYLQHRTIHFDEVVDGKKIKDFSEVKLDVARDYSCEDADVTLRLYEILSPKVEKDFSKLFHEIEMPLVDVLVDMQICGMKVDLKALKKLSNEFGAKMEKLSAKIFDLAGGEFNVNSPKQLGEILFGKLGLEGGKKTKTGFSTSQDVLEDLALNHDIARLVLDYRSISKLKSTYADALPMLVDPNTDRLHTSFNQARTATGRLSSSDPNLQNIPARTEDGRRIRLAFIADEGNLLLSCDYSQIELRVLAHLSHDENLLEAFSKNVDVHSVTASGIFGVKVEDVTKDRRAVGKTVTSATIYGQGAFGLSKQLGISPVEAADYIDNYFKKYPRVEKYRDEVLEKARADGFVETMFGRRRELLDINSKNKQLKQIAERMAFNTVFQGTAADIIKIAMIEIHKGLPAISKSAKMILQVHDELVFEIPEGDAEKVQEFVVDKMSNSVKLDVPLTVDAVLGKNWAK